MNVRKIVFCIALVFLFTFSFAGRKDVGFLQNTPNYDKKRFHFGFLLGADVLNFGIKAVDNIAIVSDGSIYAISSKPRGAFSVGIVTNLHMGPYFDFRFIPTLTLGDRILIFSEGKGGNFIIQTEKKIESTLIEFPFEFKRKAKRMGNSRPYVSVGAKYMLDLASLAKKKSENSDDILVKLKESDAGITLGVGWDFFLPFGTKMALEFKFFWGFTDILQRENNRYTNYIDHLNSKFLQFYLTFE